MMKTTRRGFFTRTAALAATALAVRLGQSSDGVPRRHDLRDGRADPMLPVDIWLDGIKRRYVVAYDLDAQALVRHRRDPNGAPVFAPADQWVTERGRLVVRWQERS